MYFAERNPQGNPASVVEIPSGYSLAPSWNSHDNISCDAGYIQGARLAAPLTSVE